tara:strand:+ start:6036 stop:6479 length:444 start_codon:yes stop_codon:yes gene_type:complete
MLDEGVHFQMGNLGREWEEKVTPTGKTVYENALAVSESKDSETFWVTLNVWEDSRDNSIALPEAVAKATGKGSRIMVRGKFSSRSAKKKDGSMGTYWDCNVWDLASIIRPDSTSSWKAGETHQEGMTEDKKRKIEQLAGFDPNEEPF